MRRVGVADLKNQLSKHLRAVEAGEVIEVTDRDRPIARLEPVRPTPEVRIRPSQRPFSEIRNRVYPAVDWPVDVVGELLAERRER